MKPTVHPIILRQNLLFTQIIPSKYRSKMVAPIAKQSWVASGVLLNMLGQGMVVSYPSSLLPGLKDPESTIKVTLSSASWLASSVGISSMFGFFVSSFFMEWWGRKISHGLVILPGTCGWILIHFSQNITTLMIGRILCGITTGATITLGAVVLGEYTSPSHRGMFLNLKTASVCLGNTIMHLLGSYYHWRTVALYALASHFLAFAVICTWPESPAWLASKKQYEKSERAFYWLRGNNEESLKEYDSMIRAQKEISSNTPDRSALSSVRKLFKKFGEKNFVKPVIIILFGSIVLEASGRHNFPAYFSIIIQEISGSKTQSIYYILFIDLIITASAIFSSFLVKLIKRRTLLFSTGAAALLVLSATCLYLLLVSKQVISKEHTWIPLSMLVVYFTLANLGCAPIPFAFLGEIIPLAHRSAGAAVSGITLSLLLMIALKVTPYLLVSIGLHGMFAVFGLALAGALMVLYFILPETKDRTLQEIEDYFNYGEFKDDKTTTNDEEVKFKIINN